MEKKSDILKEINEISPLIAGLPRHNVFTVPDGYFESLYETIESTVGLQEVIGEAHSHPSPEIPSGYFDNLSTNILKRIKQSEAPADEPLHFLFVEEQGKKNVFEIPEHYFDDLSVNIMARIRDAAESYSFDIPELRNKNVYSVPEKYFESLPSKILSQLEEPATARVIPFYQRPVFRYAVAAAVAVILFAGVFFRMNNVNPDNSFAVVNAKTVPYKAALKYNSEQAFEKGISSLTEDQIMAYLQDHGNILDNTQLIKNTDFSGMPEPFDYLENENVLDSYLRKISAGNL